MDGLKVRKYEFMRKRNERFSQVQKMCVFFSHNEKKKRKGACFVGMGMHYWKDVSVDMNCNDAYPIFLLC